MARETGLRQASENGVDDGARTHDRRNHNPVLYQLSYAHHWLCPARAGRVLYNKNPTAQRRKSLLATRCGAPGRTRTCNRMLRRHVLYPVELRAPWPSRSKLVGVEGFEPPTHCSQSSCATRLRYTPNGFILPIRQRAPCGTRSRKWRARKDSNLRPPGS